MPIPAPAADSAQPLTAGRAVAYRAHRAHTDHMMKPDGIPWAGPLCSTCGEELAPEAVVSGESLIVAYLCPSHGVIAVVADLFDSQT